MIKNHPERKFVDSIPVSDWEIMTDTGWKPITAIHKTVPYRVYEIITETGKTLKCADTHIIFDESYEEIFARNCLGKRIITVDGSELVVDLIIHDDWDNMYDLTVDSEEHRFWSDGILSHNTTTAAAFFLWYILFHREKTIGIMANKQSMAKEILSRIKKMYVYLPRFLKIPIRSWNAKSIELCNDSRILTSATTADAFRGQSLAILYGDEFAFVPTNIQADFMASVYPTITSGKDSKVIFTTTPNGMSGEFYKLWVEAQEGKNRFKTLKFTWRDIPGRDEKWKEETIANIGETRFEVEFNSAFLGSSKTLISADVLKDMRWDEPIVNHDGVYSVYEKPQEGHVYFMSCDVGYGKGLDYSTFTIFDITDTKNVRQVAVYRNNNIEPLVFPTVIASSARTYNNAFVLVENNDVGKTVADILSSEYSIDNLLYTKREKARGSITETGTYRLALSGNPGVRTTAAIKSRGCSNLKQMIETKALQIRDKDTISELMVFIDGKGNGRYAAEKGDHDDLVMNAVLLAWAMSEKFFQGFIDSNFRLDLFKEKITEVEQELMTMGFTNTNDHSFVENGIVWNSVSTFY